MARFVCNPGTLSGLPFFSVLTSSELEAALPAVQHRAGNPRECILRAHDPVEGIYLILAGRVNLLLQDAHGREIMLGMRQTNEFFGETAVFSDHAPPARVECAELSEFLLIPRRAVLRAVETNPRAAALMLGLLGARLAEAQQKIGNLGLLDVYGRVCSVIVDYAREVDGQWLLETGSERIASMVGASREMVSRVVKRMIGAGALRREKRRLIVLDRSALVAHTNLSVSDPG